jgi:hypothetical protein
MVGVCRPGEVFQSISLERQRYFKQAADSNDEHGAKYFGCSLERGEGADAGINRAVHYYRKAALPSHRDGMYNCGRRLEYGKRIDQDLVRAAKYYRLSAEFYNVAGEYYNQSETPRSRSELPSLPSPSRSMGSSQSIFRCFCQSSFTSAADQSGYSLSERARSSEWQC